VKIFITGGTGFIGNYLVNRLKETQHELHCLAREKSNTQFLKEIGAHIIKGDVTDKTSLLKGMDGCDWVIHLASNQKCHEKCFRKGHFKSGLHKHSCYLG
jgi:nucleoside-diphosphate-sugar epimerase